MLDLLKPILNVDGVGDVLVDFVEIVAVPVTRNQIPGVWRSYPLL